MYGLQGGNKKIIITKLSEIFGFQSDVVAFTELEMFLYSNKRHLKHQNLALFEVKHI